ncbi:hypothetical protein J1614_005060 [Plenodomus biglobosus]|nr:hypothetical protein J1614_005060 [Plenodomus biglobosus]
MAPKRRKTPVHAPEPKRRVTRSSAKDQALASRPSTAEPSDEQSINTDPAVSHKSKNPTNRLPRRATKAHKPNAKPNASALPTSPPPPQNYTTLTITSPLVKTPLKCQHYLSQPTKNSQTLIFTHGAGGTLSAPAVQNFCTGFSLTHPLLAFQGSMNLASRVKGFHACIAELFSRDGDASMSKSNSSNSNSNTNTTKSTLLLGGRSMGSRAAVIAATQYLTSPDHNHDHPTSVQLLLISYPLLGPKNDVRDQILLDLPPGVRVLFVVGDRDAMCPLAMLGDTRRKMGAASQLVVVRGADHGMRVRAGMVEREVGEETGRVAARWIEGELEGDVSYIGSGEGDDDAKEEKE